MSRQCVHLNKRNLNFISQCDQSTDHESGLCEKHRVLFWEEECSICLTRIMSGAGIKLDGCKHVFHRLCFWKWSLNQEFMRADEYDDHAVNLENADHVSCPNCRHPVSWLDRYKIDIFLSCECFRHTDETARAHLRGCVSDIERLLLRSSTTHTHVKHTVHDSILENQFTTFLVNMSERFPDRTAQDAINKRILELYREIVYQSLPATVDESVDVP